MADLSLQHMDSLVVACSLCRSKVCGILVPQPGIEPVYPALQGGFLTTWLSRMSREALQIQTWPYLECHSQTSMWGSTFSLLESKKPQGWEQRAQATSSTDSHTCEWGHSGPSRPVDPPATVWMSSSETSTEPPCSAHCCCFKSLSVGVICFAGTDNWNILISLHSDKKM